MLGQAAWETIPGMTQDALSAPLSQSSFAEIDFGPLRTSTYADVYVFAAVFELRDAVLALGEISGQNATKGKKLYILAQRKFSLVKKDVGPRAARYDEEQLAAYLRNPLLSPPP